MNKIIVYNLEPNYYSEKAKQIWIENNFDYVEGCFEEISDYNKCDRVEILIIKLKNYIDKSILKYFKNLKYILTATTGTVHLSSEILNHNKLKVFSLKNQKSFLENITSTPELTWGLLLAIYRNIHTSYRDVLRGNWDRDNFFGHQLFNKTIGIIGLGRVGLQIAKYAEAFRMNILYYDPNVNNIKYKKLNKIEDVFSQSDIISIHVHVTESTRNMINSKLLSLCKKETIIINTSRGEIWNEYDVINALRLGQIKGIATDVISDETLSLEKSPIWINRKNYNILITPHIAGASFDALEMCELKVQSNFLNQFK